MSAIDDLAHYELSRMDASHLVEVVELERLSSTNPWTEESFRRELEENVYSRLWVAITRAAPRVVVGHCVSWVVFEDLHIQNIAVHPQHRRMGLARKLLARAIDEGVGAGAVAAHLEVRRSNVPAQKLYEAMEFLEQGVRDNYYSRPREDAIVLKKELR